jgi:hypothetical protein
MAEIPLEGRSLMDKQVHTIASDFHRTAMLQFAMRKASELAREGFYHGLGTLEMRDDDLALFAEEEWRRYTLRIGFDYPSYAHTLFVDAYRMAYRAYARALPDDLHPNLQILIAEFEAEMGLALEK